MLEGRTIRSADALDRATRLLLLKGRRRLAVVDGAGRLVGLLCLKQDGTGYCSNKAIRERARDRGTSTSSG
jgi:hypothetical protein